MNPYSWSEPAPEIPRGLWQIIPSTFSDLNWSVFMTDEVNHPKHYNEHPSGVECIDIVRHMTFNAGNVFKYLWRAGLKDSESSLKDHKKALFYLQDEIARLEGEADIEAMEPTAEEIAEAAAREAVEADRRWANAAKTAELLKEGPGLSSAREETNRSVAAAVNYIRKEYGKQGPTTTFYGQKSLGMITVVRYDNDGARHEIRLEGSSDETVAEFLIRVKRFIPPFSSGLGLPVQPNWRLFRYRPEFSQKSGYFATESKLGDLIRSDSARIIYLGAI